MAHEMSLDKPTISVLLSIVIPVYNGAETVGNLVNELIQVFEGESFEIVLVNDGSKDNSAEICENLVDTAPIPIMFVNLARNFGEHNAVMAGLRYARGEYVITIDDDFQHLPSEVLKLFRYARKARKDVLYTYYQKKQHSAWRNFGSWLTNKMADILLDKPKGVYLSTFRCMNAFLVKQICRYEGPFPYIDGLILQITQNIGQIEVIHAPRTIGKSGYTLRKIARLWLSTFINFSIVPLQISTLFGFLLSAGGLIFALIIVVEHYTIGTPLGYGSLICAVLVFSGVQLISLGLIGEYIGRIYLTANKRPQFVVRNVIRQEK